MMKRSTQLQLTQNFVKLLQKDEKEKATERRIDRHKQIHRQCKKLRPMKKLCENDLAVT